MSDKSLIKFLYQPEHKGVFPEPVAANKVLPSFYKSLKPQWDDGVTSGTAKRCIPFLEATSAGYIIPLWADLEVKTNNGEISLTFPDYLPMSNSLGQHDIQQLKGYPLEDNPYGSNLMKFINPWTIETPEGYSCMFMSPMNHFETRFKIIDGIVDTDNYYNQVNFPFVWTGGDGSFFIPQGTPLVQVVPFKRQETTSVVEELDIERDRLTKSRLGTKLFNSYRQLNWHKRKDETNGGLDV